MSAKELSDSYGIPIGSCYRLIRTLISEGVLMCTLAVSKEGRAVPLFRTCSAQDASFVKRR